MADFSLDQFQSDLMNLTSGGKRWDRPSPGTPVNLNIGKMATYSPLAEAYQKNQAQAFAAQASGRDLTQEELDALHKSKEDYDVATSMTRALTQAPTKPLEQGAGTTLKNLVTAPLHPLQTLAGVGEIAVGLGKSLAENVGNAVQAFSPVDANTLVPDKLKPYVQFPPQYTGQGQQPVGQLVKGEIRQLTGAVPLVGGMLAKGWIDAYQNRLDENVNYTEGNANPDAKIKAAMGATVDAAAGVVNPIRTLLTGEVADPQHPGQTIPASIQDTVAAFGNTALLGAAARAGYGALEAKGMAHPLELLEGKQIPARTLKGTISVGEMKAADLLKSQIDNETKAKLGDVKAKPGAVIDPEDIAALPVKSEYPVLDQMQASKEYQTLHPEIQKAVSVEMMLDQPAYRKLVSDLVVDPVRAGAVFEYMKNGSSLYQSMAKVLDDPNLTEVHVPESMSARGATPESMQSVIAASFENTVHQGGQSLQAMSDVMSQLEDQFQGKARSGNVADRVDAQKTLQLISQWRNKTGSGSYLAPSLQASGIVEGITQKAQQFERLRIGYMLSQVSTALHIAKSQGAIAGADLFDAFNTGIVASAGQAFSKGPIEAFKNFNQNFADLTTQLHTIKAAMTPVMVAGVDENGMATRSMSTQLNASVNPILDKLPMTKGRLLTGIAAEADNTLGFLSANYTRAFKQAVEATKGLPEGDSKVDAFQNSISASYNKIKELGHFDLDNKPGFAYDSAMLGADIMTAPLRMQEMFFRKMAFKSRLESNLKQSGYTMDRAMGQLDRAEFEPAIDRAGNPVVDANGHPVNGDIKKIDPNLRWSIADAENHALRQTWAADPEGGVLHAGVNAVRMFNSVSPLQSSMVFTPFVRAMANNMMWQAHHSPGWILDLLQPKYREAWLRPGEKMSLADSLNVQRRVGESMTGLYMLMAGVHTALGGQVGNFSKGPNPWTWTTGESKDDRTGQAVQNTYDLRNILPMQASYNTIAQIMVDKMEGRDTNVTPEQVLDVIGNTRVESVPIFNFGEAIKNAAGDSDKTSWNAALGKFLGNYLGPFGNIVKTFREQFGDGIAAVPYNALVHHTLGGTPFDQPSMKNDPVSAPFLRGMAPGTLPPNVNPFTGNVSQQTRPTEDLAAPLGAPKQLTPMEYLLSSQKGLTTSMITKQYDNTVAQNLVNKYTSNILNNPTFKFGDLQIQDWAKKMIAVDNPEQSKWQLGLILPIIHQASELQAMGEDSRIHGGGVPPDFIPQIQAMLPSLGIKSVEQAWQQKLKALALKQESQRGGPN